MATFINKTVKLFFTALIGLIVFGLSYKLVFYLISSPVIALAAAAVIVVAISVFFVLSAKPAEKLYQKTSAKLSGVSPVKLAVILGIVCLVTKVGLVLVFDADSNLHADMERYISYANQIANQGCITEEAGYAATFAYTIVYGLLLSPIARFCGTDSMGYAIILSVLVSVVMVLLFDILRRYAGNTTAFAGLLVYNLLPMGLFQTQVVIHETPLLFFHVLTFWLLEKVLNNKYKIITNILLCTLICVLASVGGSVNAAGRVVIVSFAIYAIAKLLGRKLTKENLVKTIALILCVFMLLGVCYMATKYIPKACRSTFVAVDQSEDKAKRLPYGWALYLGSNYETHGSWNETDSTTYDMYLEYETQEEAYEYQRNLLNERLSQYKENPLKIPSHLIQKVWLLWSPYFSYSAVPDSPGYQNLLYSFGGIFQKGLFAINYLGFIMFYFMALIGMYNKKTNEKRYNTPVLHFMMVPLGVTAALILFEVAPKYSSHMQILLFCVGIINFSTFRLNISAIRSKLCKK